MQRTLPHFAATLLLLLFLLTCVTKPKTPKRHKKPAKQITHTGVVLRGHNTQKFSVMKGGQQANTKKDIATIMDHLGVDEYTIGPQKCSPEAVQAERQKWFCCIDQLLKSAKASKSAKVTKDKIIHHFDVIKAACKAGMTYANLRSVQQPGEKTPVSASTYSAIKRGTLTKKQRERYCAHGLSEETKELIRNFWYSISRVCPNDNYVVKRASKHHPEAVTLPLYYRDYSIKESFELFKERNPTVQIARSTLHKYKPKNVKKPRSRQDCCPVCKEYRAFKNALERRSTTILSAEELKIKNQFEFHRSVKECQEIQFAVDINSLAEGETVIVMDFKANITLGRGPEEDSHVFFNAPQRTLFGAVAYLKKGENIYKVIFTIVSPVLKHDSRTLLEMLHTSVFNHNVFKHFKVKKASIWMDNAPQHFRNMETLATFDYLREHHSLELTLNYFAEYHGKSECDRHFGWLSSLYKEKTRYQDRPDVATTQDFLELYTSGVREAGGHVIPATGASFDELHPETSHKLNVVATIWEHEGVNEFMNNLTVTPEDSKEEKRRKKKLQKRPFMALPYTKKTLLVENGSGGVKFVLNYFYDFTFKKNSKGEKFIRCALKRDSKQKWDFPYSVVEEGVDYVVKLGVASSKREEFADLKRISARQSFHMEALEEEMEEQE